VPQKALESISEHAFLKNFLRGLPSHPPIGGSCFAFWRVLCTLQVNPPTHRSLNFILTLLYKSLDPALLIAISI